MKIDNFNIDQKTPPSPKLVLFFAILAASSAAIFIRFAQVGAPSLVIAAGRLCLASLILTGFVLPNRWSEISHLKPSYLWLMFLSGFLLAVHFASWINSLALTSVASSVVLVATTPLWVALFAPLVLHEKIGKYPAIGLAVALAGTIFVGASEICEVQLSGIACGNPFETVGGSGLLGNFLALVGAWCAAFYLMIGRTVRLSVSLMVYTWVVYGTAALFLLVMVIAAGQSVVGYSTEIYLWILALALVPQLIGHSLFNWSLKYVPAAFVAIALLGEPVASTILALFILGEAPTLLELAGGLIILTGIYLSSRGNN